MKNVFYFKKISALGGCESWFWYLSKLYKNMVVYYKEGDSEQIKRLAQNIEVHKYKENEIITCDNFFCCYNPDIIDNVNAKIYAHIIHCDYKQVSFSPIINEKFNKYIAVSKLAGESFKELTGLDYELIYNPIKIDIPKVEKYKDNKLHLISATRLTKEKGLARMQKLASMLDNAKIDYEWVVFSNRQRQFIGNKVVYNDPKLDIIEEIAKADYLIQLSDCESYCYSVVESLMVGTKVIVTDLPVFKELGLNKENSIICNLDMNNVNVNDITKEYKKIKYTPPKDEWSKYLDNESTYNPNELVEVRVLRRYTDIILGQLIRSSIVKMSKARASYLEAKDLVIW